MSAFLTTFLPFFLQGKLSTTINEYTGKERIICLKTAPKSSEWCISAIGSILCYYTFIIHFRYKLFFVQKMVSYIGLTMVPVIATAICSILIVIKVGAKFRQTKSALRKSQEVERAKQERQIRRQLLLVVLGFFLAYIPISG